MKEFLHKKHFDFGTKVMLSLLAFQYALGYILFQEADDVTFFNIYALIFPILVYAVTVVLDPEKYYNLASFLITILFGYLIFWFMFTVISNN